MPRRRRAVLLGLAVAAGLVLAAIVAASCGLGRRASASAALASNVCYECHIDFRAEELVVDHEKHGVTCVRCHGPSQAHMEDEVRRTPPDATFRGKAIAVFCLTCHARTRRHAEEVAKADVPRTCTQCHGAHRIIETPPPKPS